MTKFVWVYGPTAVGKNTLITGMVENPDHPMNRLLELEQPVFLHQEALSLFHQERDGIELKIAETRGKAPTILIKTQYYDVVREVPLRLRESLPSDTHLLVYLDVSTDIIRDRRIKRGSPGPGWDDENDRRANAGVAVSLEDKGMPTIWLNNNGDNPIVAVRPTF